MITTPSFAVVVRCLRSGDKKVGAKKCKNNGPSRDLNPGPATTSLYEMNSEEPEAAIMRLDHWALIVVNLNFITTYIYSSYLDIFSR